ncbi:alkaline phosphatase family protein [Mucilaginibacter sp. AW1-7]|uniref:alkaline phosphatase family protein n=1 Tax=Mucilaginibacter sp. AW1-7 TaxID=3349874 RepID=UPI003F73E495
MGAFAQAKHVVLISIDGFRPAMYLDKDWDTPNLRKLMREGTYSDKLISVFPAYTYPAHTAMVTGAMPARSGIIFNQPIGSKGEWFWFADNIKVPTLWQALKAKGFTTASVEWPVSVTRDITWNIPEIWPVGTPDRVTEAKKYATPGLFEEVQQNATGKLDTSNFNDEYASLDDNAARIAAYIFKTRKPAFMAVHFANVDSKEHENGTDGEAVKLAVASNDHAVGIILEEIAKSKAKDSTAVIIVGDHGFVTINTIMRPNLLIKSLPAKFIASGGSCFLYGQPGTEKQVIDSLNKLPKDKRGLFRIIDRKELDHMGADSNALLALTAQPGMVFSGSVAPAKATNLGVGTFIQNSPLEGVFIPTQGGHHGYDPNIKEMWTGFIAAGAGIKKGGHIDEIHMVDIAPLIAKLLGIEFKTPDGRLVNGIIE